MQRIVCSKYAIQAIPKTLSLPRARIIGNIINLSTSTPSSAVHPLSPTTINPIPGTPPSRIDDATLTPPTTPPTTTGKEEPKKPKEESMFSGESAPLLFQKVWNELENEYGRENLKFPGEIIWLMGAPGSGKGTHTIPILRARGITNPPVAISSILAKTQKRELMDKGYMIKDSVALKLLLQSLLDCEENIGVLVDGFPRTERQVEFLQLLKKKMWELREEFMKKNCNKYNEYCRPTFRIVVLYVDEETSVQRQLARGAKAKAHNEQVRRTGRGRFLEERVTDFDKALARKRYSIFRDHYGTLLKLKEMFPFHFIFANGTIPEVNRVILKEFEYQSSLELDQQTYDRIMQIPIASKIAVHARQELIARLEGYQVAFPNKFKEAIHFIESDIMPSIKRHAIAGQTLFRTNNETLNNPLFADMVMDVLSERGYLVTFDRKERQIPSRIDKETMQILHNTIVEFTFHIRFPGYHIRNSISDIHLD